MVHGIMTWKIIPSKRMVEPFPKGTLLTRTSLDNEARMSWSWKPKNELKSQGMKCRGAFLMGRWRWLFFYWFLAPRCFLKSYCQHLNSALWHLETNLVRGRRKKFSHTFQHPGSLGSVIVIYPVTNGLWTVWPCVTAPRQVPHLGQSLHFNASFSASCPHFFSL